MIIVVGEASAVAGAGLGIELYGNAAEVAIARRAFLINHTDACLFARSHGGGDFRRFLHGFQQLVEGLGLEGNLLQGGWRGLKALARYAYDWLCGDVVAGESDGGDVSVGGCRVAEHLATGEQKGGEGKQVFHGGSS